MTVGGMGFIPERLLMMMMMTLCLQRGDDDDDDDDCPMLQARSEHTCITVFIIAPPPSQVKCNCRKAPVVPPVSP